MPAAFTAMRTWPGPGRGSGCSRTFSTSGGPCSVITSARIARKPTWVRSALKNGADEALDLRPAAVALGLVLLARRDDRRVAGGSGVRAGRGPAAGRGRARMRGLDRLYRVRRMPVLRHVGRLGVSRRV